MKTLKRFIFAVCVLVLFFWPSKIMPSKALGASPQGVSHEMQSVPEMIAEIAPRFNQDAFLIGKIAYCESHYENVVHDGGYGKGVTGIHANTFARWLPLYEKDQGESLDYDSTYDQLKMMAWAFSKGDEYRNQWTTYVAYMNGGTYSFYSRLLKGHYTVHCK